VTSDPVPNLSSLSLSAAFPREVICLFNEFAAQISLPQRDLKRILRRQTHLSRPAGRPPQSDRQWLDQKGVREVSEYSTECRESGPEAARGGR
jgi:hypothetical protein